MWATVRSTEPHTRRPLSKGVSYAEVLFSMSILSVGILGTAGAVSTAALNIFQGGRETFAVEQGQAILERIRNSASYEDLLSYADTPPAGASSPRPAYVEDNRTAWVSDVQSAFGETAVQVQARIDITQQGIVPNRLAMVTVSIDVPGRSGWSPPTFVTQVAEWP